MVECGKDHHYSFPRSLHRTPRVELSRCVALRGEDILGSEVIGSARTGGSVRTRVNEGCEMSVSTSLPLKRLFRAKSGVAT